MNVAERCRLEAELNATLKGLVLLGHMSRSKVESSPEMKTLVCSLNRAVTAKELARIRTVCEDIYEQMAKEAVIARLKLTYVPPTVTTLVAVTEESNTFRIDILHDGIVQEGREQFEIGLDVARTRSDLMRDDEVARLGNTG